MSETQRPEDQADVSAEKAYAEAAEAARVTADELPAKDALADADVPKAARAPKPGRKAAATSAPTPVVADAAPAPKARKPGIVKAAVPAKPAAPIAAAKLPAKKVPTARPVAVTPAKPSVIPTASQLKDKTMDMNTKFTDGIKTAVSDAQEKAKDIYSKGAALAGECGEFTKGNVKAAVASTKILASGLKDMGDTLVADTKAVVETASADFKSFTTVKSPSEFVQLQSDLLQRNLDKAVAYNSKTAETLLKLTNEVMAPVSERFSLAIERIRKAA